MVRLKVCCIMSREEAALAIAHGAHAIGLVGAMPSGPGPIDDATIAEIARAAPPAVGTFLLTSRTEAGAIIDHVRLTGVNTVQIVDAVEPAVYRALRASLPAVKLVQVIHVEDESAIDAANAAAAHVDALLLDSGRPKAAIRELGGTGRAHDWRVSARIVAQCGRPVFLAGGLNPGNVGAAVARVRPFGVDLCSGLRSDGRLDAAKLGAFVAALRVA
jgi:phosphoribosylanthranilate isomerase